MDAKLYMVLVWLAELFASIANVETATVTNDDYQYGPIKTTQPKTKARKLFICYTCNYR